jgi:deoxyhypusine synthase
MAVNPASLSSNPFFAHFYLEEGKKQEQAATVSSTHEELLRRVLDTPEGGIESTHFHEARKIVATILKQRWDVEQADAAMSSSSQSSVLATPASPQLRRRRPKIILAYTSNLISCGLREVFAYLARHNLIDAFVSTAGGVEEDVIKCLGDTLVGDFALPGAGLREQGLNRVGNLLIPNDNYVSFEEFFVPVVERLHKKQLASNYRNHTSPTEVNYEMGLELGSPEARQYLYSPTFFYRKKDSGAAPKITTAFSTNTNNTSTTDEDEFVATAEEEEERTQCLERSLVYWCSKNRIPLYCPALTDGSMGDMICFYEWRQKGFMVDPMADFGWLLPFGDDEDVNTTTSTGEEEEEQEVLVLCLGAGLPRNYALNMTPTTGTHFLRNYWGNKEDRLDVDDGASPLPYPSSTTTATPSSSDVNQQYC